MNAISLRLSPRGGGLGCGIMTIGGSAVRMECSECKAEVFLVVDGKILTEEQLGSLRYAPQNMKHHVNHARWCSEVRKYHIYD